MSIQPVVQQAQEYMTSQGVDGWLVYDYRGLNPILSDTVGRCRARHEASVAVDT